MYADEFNENYKFIVKVVVVDQLEDRYLKLTHQQSSCMSKKSSDSVGNMDFWNCGGADLC